MTAHFVVLPTGDGVEGGSAVGPSRFPVRLLTKCGSTAASKVVLGAAHFGGLQGIFHSPFVPQVAAEVEATVREVQEALQLLQEQVA